MTDNIKPEHYRQGEIDLFEEWYLTYPFDQYRAIMQSHAEKYLRRNKVNRVEDLGKGIYTLERLKEKEIEYREKQEKVKSNKTLKEAFDDIGKAFGGINFDEWYRKQKYDEDIYLLKGLLERDFEYLARDKDGVLSAYDGSPMKVEEMGYWDFYVVFDSETIQNNNFPEVQWTDEEPTMISKLLATYENGGENGKKVKL